MITGQMYQVYRGVPSRAAASWPNIWAQLEVSLEPFPPDGAPDYETSGSLLQMHEYTRICSAVDEMKCLNLWSMNLIQLQSWKGVCIIIKIDTNGIMPPKRDNNILYIHKIVNIQELC